MRTLLAGLILSAFVVAGCGDGEQGNESAARRVTTADDAYEEVLKKRKVMDSMDERLALTREFLAEFPESEHTARAVDAVFYYLAEQRGDTSGAIAYAETIRDRIDDPDIAQAVDRVMVGLYAKAGMAGKMAILADRLAEAGALDFDDHWNVVEGAVKAEDWRLVRDYCARAREMANAEGCKADEPNREFSEEELSDAVNNRVGMLLVKEAWARANQGDTGAALADFARADKLIPRYYFDIPEYGLNVHWARTLIMEGKFESAIERLATDGLVMRNESAMAALEAAYVGLHGDRSGFEAYTAELHHRVARTIDDFEMPDYAGVRRRFSDLRADVTLLAFWFPT